MCSRDGDRGLMYLARQTGSTHDCSGIRKLGVCLAMAGSLVLALSASIKAQTATAHVISAATQPDKSSEERTYEWFDGLGFPR